MEPSELKHAIERARALREDLQAIRQVYEKPEQLQAEDQDAKIGRELFTELMNTLQSLTSDLEELLPRREIQLGEERMYIRTALPSSIRPYLQPEGNILVLQGRRIRPILEDIIRKLGWIPPWIIPWPWPWPEPGDEISGDDTDKANTVTS